MRPLEAALLTALLTTHALYGAELILPVDDFADGDIEAESGLSWIVVGDDLLGGASSASLVVSPSGAGDSDGALRFEGQVEEGFAAPFLGTWSPLTPGGRSIDLSAYRGLRFLVRGSGGSFQAGVRLAGGSNFMASFTVVDDWRSVEIPFDTLHLSGPAHQEADWSAKDAAWIGFTTEPGFLGQFDIEIDSIEFYGDPPPRTPVTKVNTLPAAVLSQLSWRSVGSEGVDDIRSPRLPDARRLEMATDATDGRIWFRVLLADPLPPRWLGFNLALDVDGDSSNGMAWWGHNTQFHFDRLISVYLNRGASYWQGWVGVGASDTISTGGLDSISSDVAVVLDRDSRAVAVGVPRDALGGDRIRLISTVGSSLLDNDDLPDEGAIQVDLER